MAKHDKVAVGVSTILNPVPVVMVSSGSKEGKANIMTAAWAGTVNSEPPMISVSIRKSRYSHKLISETGEFVVNLVSKSLCKACDYCGVRGGENEDKFKSCGLTPVKAEGLLDQNGKLCLENARLVAYNHGEYYLLGEKLGFFGYSVAKEDVIKRRMGNDTKKGKK